MTKPKSSVNTTVPIQHGGVGSATIPQTSGANTRGRGRARVNPTVSNGPNSGTPTLTAAAASQTEAPAPAQAPITHPDQGMSNASNLTHIPTAATTTHNNATTSTSTNGGAGGVPGPNSEITSSPSPGTAVPVPAPTDTAPPSIGVPAGITSNPGATLPASNTSMAVNTNTGTQNPTSTAGTSTGSGTISSGSGNAQAVTPQQAVGQTHQPPALSAPGDGDSDEDSEGDGEEFVDLAAQTFTALPRTRAEQLARLAGMQAYLDVLKLNMGSELATHPALMPMNMQSRHMIEAQMSATDGSINNPVVVASSPGRPPADTAPRAPEASSNAAQGSGGVSDSVRRPVNPPACTQDDTAAAPGEDAWENPTIRAPRTQVIRPPAIQTGTRDRLNGWDDVSHSNDSNVQSSHQQTNTTGGKWTGGGKDRSYDQHRRNQEPRQPRNTYQADRGERSN